MTHNRFHSQVVVRRLFPGEASASFVVCALTQAELRSIFFSFVFQLRSSSAPFSIVIYISFRRNRLLHLEPHWRSRASLRL
ncbi:hypothetical protein LXL04_008524 [Taraxacum kok-saghyz]